MAELSAAEKQRLILIQTRDKIISETNGLCFWNYHEPFIKDGVLKIKCLACGTLLTSSNPTASMKSHFGGKKCTHDGKKARVSYLLYFSKRLFLHSFIM